MTVRVSPLLIQTIALIFRYSLFLFCLSSTAAGQTPPLNFTHYTIDDGLSQNSINCIFQDSRGFMWFGTEDGLNRFDGYEFTVFKHNPTDSTSISDNLITAICEDDSGFLWIGTEGGGLNRLDIKTETFKHYLNNEEKPIILRLAKDNLGHLWIGTLNQGLIRIHLPTMTHEQILHQEGDDNSISENRVAALLVDHNNDIWIGTEKEGLNRYNPITKEIVQYRHQPDDPRTISSDVIISVYQDRDHDIWVGTLNGLNRLDLNTHRFTRYYHEPDNPKSISTSFVGQLLQDSFGTFWIGTVQGGLNLFDKNTGHFTRYQKTGPLPVSISSNQIACVYEDRQGGIWLGTWGGGLNRVDLYAKKFYTVSQSPYNPASPYTGMIQCFYETPSGQLWLGTNKGLQLYNPETRQTRRFTVGSPDGESGANDIHSIVPDENQRIWLGTSQGVFHFHTATGTYQRLEYNISRDNDFRRNIIWKMVKDHQNNLWIGTRKGLYRYNLQSGAITCYNHDPEDPNSLGNDDIRTLYLDGLNRLWIGTYQGFYRFDESQNRFTAFTDPPGFSGNLHKKNTLCLHQSPDEVGEKIWVGTIIGLFHFDLKTGEYRQFTEKDGLPSSMVFGILEDDDANLWISTAKGLVGHNRKEGSFRTYDKKDGLPGDEFRLGAFQKNQQGRLFFGGINGWVAFSPQKIKNNPFTPRVVLTDLQVFNQSVEIGSTVQGRIILDKSIEEMDAITLSHHQQVFSIDFAALHYACPEKNRYAYKLDGLEKQWNRVDSQRRFATYTNLNAGHYTFKVKATNNDGIWSQTEKNLRIHVLPPPWKTWWAYTLYFLAFFGIVTQAILSQRKKYLVRQEELRRLQAIFDNTTSIMYMKDLQGRYMMINRRFEEVYNLSREDVIHKTPYDLFPHENAALFESADKKVLKENRALEFEEKIRVNDEYRTYISVRFPLVDANRKPYSICGISTDITQRKLAEEEMSHLRNLLRNIINSMPSALIGVDHQARITQWNNGAEKMTGISSPKAAGRPIDEIYPHGYLQLDNIVKAIKERQIQRDLKVKHETEGGTHYFDILCFPLISNGVEGAVIRIDDVTERVKLEEMIIQSEKMMSVGGLAAGMAHEINNPLAGIMQSIQVLENRLMTPLPINEKAAEECGFSMEALLKYTQKRGLDRMMTSIIDSGRRVAKIVQTMLSFSRKSESALSLQNIPCLLDETLELASNDYDLKKNYDFRTIEIIREYEENLPRVRCSPGEIQQVFLNLLKNGAQAMNEVKERPSRFILRVRKEGSFLAIEIEDNGPGIPPEVSRHVFDPFFTTKTGGEGTGLGLSVSNFIITNNHKGKMTVNSMEGVGTTFTILLPMDSDPESISSTPS